MVCGGGLKAAITFGKPASPYVCEGICGKEWSKNVYELNRLCRDDDFHEPLSEFVGAVLRRLRVNNWIIVSYSDTAMHHNGYIYQACNFMFTGQTKERTDAYAGAGKHSRHYTQEQLQSAVRILRSAKNRYVFFCTKDKRLKRQWKEALSYPILPYPKEQNENYTLGVYIKPILINKITGERFVEPEPNADEQLSIF